MGGYKLKKTLTLVLIILGIILLSIPLLTEQIIRYQNRSIDLEELSMEKIRSNIEKNSEGTEDLEYDFSAVKDVDILSAIRASMTFDRDLVIGLLLIPDLDMELPIFKGLTDGNLMAGAATMKPDQVMGKGNYTLSGHNMKNKDLLFGSLMDIAIGSKVIISDGFNVYEYKIYENRVVPDTRLDMILDEKSEEKGKAIISLMTCFHSSRTGKRFFSLGELVDEYPVED